MYARTTFFFISCFSFLSCKLEQTKFHSLSQIPLAQPPLIEDGELRLDSKSIHAEETLIAEG